MDKGTDLNKTTLVVKNFPSEFTSTDRKEFLYHFGAVNVFMKNDVCFGTFKNDTEASLNLMKLHQMKIFENYLIVQYANNVLKNKLPQTNANGFIENNNKNEKKIEKSYRNLNNFVNKLNTFNNNINFNQPPLPYLNYKYPKANRDIIDSIAVALESIPKFYTQVLHLMNLMNIPPPFCVNSKNLKYEQTYIDCSTQTDFLNYMISNEKKNIIDINDNSYKSKDNIVTSESEIELDNDYSTEKNPQENNLRKRKLNIYCKDKMFRSVINTKKYKMHNYKSKSTDVNNLSISFEKIDNQSNKKIVINVPTNLNSGKSNEITNIHGEDILSLDTPEIKKLNKDDIANNRIPEDQLKNLLIFKNYNCGIKSTKLYIKNLSKLTTKLELLELFTNALQIDSNYIDINLMKVGRMKGQAFIKIISNSENNFDDKFIENKMEIGLKETNGYILNDKPMVVLYGKQD